MTADSPELQAYKEKAKQSANAWLSRFTLLLKAKGVKRVSVSYSGSGDDGGIESITCSKHAKGDGEKQWTEIGEVLGEDVADAFEGLVYDIITRHGAGFCDDGCSGTVEWNIAYDMFVHDLSYNITTTEDHKFLGVDDLINSVEVEVKDP